MKKHTNKHRLITIILFSVVFIIFCVLAAICLLPFPPSDRENTLSSFEENFATMEFIVDEFDNEIFNDYSLIFIDSSCFEKDPFIYTTHKLLGFREEQFHDNSFERAARDLISNEDYYSIEKSGNFIYFLKTLKFNRGYGIAYSYDGNSPNNNLFSTLEPLNTAGWFYYIN